MISAGRGFTETGTVAGASAAAPWLAGCCAAAERLRHAPQARPSIPATLVSVLIVRTSWFLMRVR